MSVFWVFLVRIKSEYGNIQARKSPNTDTFHAKHTCLNVLIFFQFSKQNYVACLGSINLGMSLLYSFNFSSISLTCSSNFYAGTSTYVPAPVEDSFNVCFYWYCFSEEVLEVFWIVLILAKIITILLVIIYCYLMRY